MPVEKGEAMIKRCPFDGGQGVAQAVGTTHWEVACRSCDARTGKCATRADALKAWNRRWAGPQPDRKM
jgi:Lar family restriction alleviation protein